MANPSADPTWVDVQRGDPAAVALVNRAVREALLIQYVGEMNRGLSIIEKELRAGDVNAARETAAFMRLATMTIDGAAR